MTTRPTVTKKCAECSKDLTGLKRAKDESGRYFCENCWIARASDIDAMNAEIIRIQSSLAVIKKSRFSTDLIVSLCWAAILVVDIAICAIAQGRKPEYLKRVNDYTNFVAVFVWGLLSFLCPLIVGRILWPIGNRAPRLLLLFTPLTPVRSELDF